MKVQTNLSIDEELKKKAQDAQIDLSAAAEYGMRHKLNIEKVNIPKESNEGTQCDYCKRPGVRATRDNLKGLTWLCPDECWICDSCLNAEIRKIVVANR